MTYNNDTGTEIFFCFIPRILHARFALTVTNRTCGRNLKPVNVKDVSDNEKNTCTSTVFVSSLNAYQVFQYCAISKLHPDPFFIRCTKQTESNILANLEDDTRHKKERRYLQSDLWTECVCVWKRYQTTAHVLGGIQTPRAGCTVTVVKPTVSVQNTPRTIWVVHTHTQGRVPDNFKLYTAVQ
jgi:hypothetical protein